MLQSKINSHNEWDALKEVIVDPPSRGTIIERAGFKLNYKNTMITHFYCFKILHFNNQIH